MCCGKSKADCNACTGCNGVEDRAFEARINGETVGSYEQSCIDFALFGSQEQESERYDFDVQFDKFEGWGDPGCEDSEPRSCGGDCTGCNTGPVFVNLVVPFNYAGSVESDVPF